VGGDLDFLAVNKCIRKINTRAFKRNKLISNYVNRILGKKECEPLKKWKEVVQDREKWRDIVIAAKTLREYEVPEKEEEKHLKKLIAI
jgi:hypothetical protein